MAPPANSFHPHHKSVSSNDGSAEFRAKKAKYTKGWWKRKDPKLMFSSPYKVFHLGKQDFFPMDAQALFKITKTKPLYHGYLLKKFILKKKKKKKLNSSGTPPSPLKWPNTHETIDQVSRVSRLRFPASS